MSKTSIKTWGSLFCQIDSGNETDLGCLKQYAKHLNESHYSLIRVSEYQGRYMLLIRAHDPHRMSVPSTKRLLPYDFLVGLGKKIWYYDALTKMGEIHFQGGTLPRAQQLIMASNKTLDSWATSKRMSEAQARPKLGVPVEDGGCASEAGPPANGDP